VTVPVRPHSLARWLPGDPPGAQARLVCAVDVPRVTATSSMCPAGT